MDILDGGFRRQSMVAIPEKEAYNRGLTLKLFRSKRRFT